MTAFDPIPGNPFTVPVGTAEDEIGLPATIDGDAGAEPVDGLGVTWSCDTDNDGTSDYDGNTPATYTFTAVLPLTHVADTGVALPTVDVIVQQASGNVTLAWNDGTAVSPARSILMGTDTTGVMNVSVNSAGLQTADTAYRLEISYRSPTADEGNAYNDGICGFAFGSYYGDTGTIDNADVTAVAKDGTNKLVYTLTPNFSFVSLPVSVLPTKLAAYDDEPVKITAELIRVDTSGETSVGTMTVDAKTDLQPVTNTVVVMMQNGILPVGPESDTTRVTAQVRIGTGGTGISSGNVQERDSVVTVNFSGVQITAGGVTKTYAEWMADQGTSPVKFYDKDGTLLDAGNSYTATWTNTGSTWGWSYFYHDFTIEVSEFFTANGEKMPTIVFDTTNMNVKIDTKLNNRGPVVSNNNQSPSAASPITVPVTKVTLTAKPSSYEVTVYGASTKGLTVQDGYDIRPDSATEIDLLKEQHLFMIEGGYAGETAQDAELVLKPSAAVSVTRIRIPETSTVASYRGVKDVVYETASGTQTLAGPFAPNEIITLTGHMPGGEISMILTDFLYIKTRAGSMYAPGLSLIHVAGMTHGLTDGDSISMSAELGAVNDPAPATKSKTSKVSDKVWGNGSIGAINSQKIVRNTTGAVTDTLRKGEEFELAVSTPGYAYPQGHLLGTDILAYQSAKTLTYDPLVFFSIPADVEVVGLTTSGSTTGYDLTGAAVTAAATILTPIDNAGEFAASGGKLVPVKIHQTGDINGEIYLLSSMTLRLQLRLLESTTQTIISYPQKAAALGTWGPAAKVYGGVISSTSMTVSAPAYPAGAYSYTSVSYAYGEPQILTIADANSVSAYVSTKLGGGSYRSVIPGREQETAPALRAGSQSENFKATIEYNLENPTTGESHFYYILPSNWDSGGGTPDWRAQLNAAPVFTSRGSAGDPGYLSQGTDYTVYYSTANFSSAAALDSTSHTLGGTWTELTGEPTGGWGSITALYIKFDAGLAYGSNLEVNMPFGLPAFAQGSSVTDGSMAIGQTLYYFADGVSTVENNAGYTGGVILRESYAPEIWLPDATDTYKIIPSTGTSIDLAYGGEEDTIPEWWKPLIADDFTQYTDGLNLASINVSFTPRGGTASEVLTLSTTDIGKEKSKVTWQMEQEPGVDVDATQTVLTLSGSALDASDAADYVNLDALGTYTITYVSTADGDGTATTRVLTLNVTKAASTITATNGEYEMFWKSIEPVGGWYNYIKKNTTGFGFKDMGVDVDSDDIEYVSGSVDVNVPGVYTLTYKYTDIANNEKTATITVYVKYRGTVDVIVRTDPVSGDASKRQPVKDAAVNLGSGDVNTNASGKQTRTLEATKQNPLSVDYSVSLVSLPDGLKAPAVTTASGTLSASNDGAEIIFTAVPITYTAVLQDNASLKWVTSVKLYKDDLTTGTLVATGTITNQGSYTFDPQDVITSGNKWFSGDYYMTVEMAAGYGADAASEFQPYTGGAASSIATVVLPAKDADISQTAIPQVQSYTLNYYVLADGYAQVAETYTVPYLEMMDDGNTRPAPAFSTVANYQANTAAWYDGTGAGAQRIDPLQTAMRAMEVNLYERQQGNIYTVTFDKNGGDTEAAPRTMTVQVPATTLSSLPAGPTKVGYLFSGWNTRADGQGTDFDTNYQVTSSLTVYAQWTPNYYNLSFDINGGSGNVPGIQPLMYGELATQPVAPTRASYTFLSWNTAADGSGTTWNFATTTMPARNVTLYAQWQYSGGGGGGDPEDPPPVNPPIIEPPEPPEPPGPPIVEPPEPPTPDPEIEPGTTTEVIADGSTPSGFQIGEDGVPLFGGAGAVWALLNFILMLAGGIFAVVLLLRTGFSSRKDDEDVEYYETNAEDEEEPKKRVRPIWTIVSVILGAVGVIVFLLTEDLSNMMVWMDQWTVLMVLILAAELVAFRLSFRKTQETLREQNV